MYKKLLAGATVLMVLIANFLVFQWVPNEKIMGPVQKIFYFHVAAAWVGFLAFFVVFVAGIAYLLKRQLWWDYLGSASAEIGVLFTTMVLLTGPIWAKPTWNTWWSWDPRLTTTLILWFIYVGYLLLRQSFAEPEQRARFAAIFGIIGFIDVPIVWFSIRWWRTIHPVVVDSSGFAMSPKMVVTLLVSTVAFTLVYAFLVDRLVGLKKLAAQVSELKNSVRIRTGL